MALLGLFNFGKDLLELGVTGGLRRLVVFFGAKRFLFVLVSRKKARIGERKKRRIFQVNKLQQFNKIRGEFGTKNYGSVLIRKQFFVATKSTPDPNMSDTSTCPMETGAVRC